MKTKPTLNIFLEVIFICISVVALSFLLAGCKCSFDGPTSSPSNIRVIVLVDETDSFRVIIDNEQSAGGKDTIQYWEAVKPLVIQIVKKLDPGDQFVFIGIDEKGFQTDDVRIPFEIIDESYLKAEQQKKRIIREVRELERKKDIHNATDILGALKHSASLDSGYQTRIFCFSDMQQFPPLNPQEATGLKFSQDTKVYFFLNTVGEQEWNRTVSIWKPIIEGAGLKFVDKGPDANFIEFTNSNVRLPEILANWK